jgi:hypothetical protein
MLARAIRPGTNPPFESIPSDRLARPRADKCDGKHGIRTFGCQSPTGRGVIRASDVVALHFGHGGL